MKRLDVCDALLFRPFLCSASADSLKRINKLPSSQSPKSSKNKTQKPRAKALSPFKPLRKSIPTKKAQKLRAEVSSPFKPSTKANQRKGRKSPAPIHQAFSSFSSFSSISILSTHKKSTPQKSASLSPLIPPTNTADRAADRLRRFQIPHPERCPPVLRRAPRLPLA